MAASNRPVAYVESAAMVEAHPLKDSLILTYGCSKLLIDSDCMEVVETMLGGRNSQILKKANEF